MHTRSPVLLSGLLAIGLALSGCMAPRVVATGDESFSDPLEDTNRAIFSFNQEVDRNVLVPVAQAYRTVVPPPAQESLRDFLRNLNHPVIFANDVLQGQPELAANTLGRFVVNTTFGVGGMFDVASRIGIPYHTTDLGMIGDSFADPGGQVAASYHKYYASLGRTVAEGIDTRSRNIESLADIERTSLDYYATIRSLYGQRRAAQIRHENTNLPNPGLGAGGDTAGPAIIYSAPPR